MENNSDTKIVHEQSQITLNQLNNTLRFSGNLLWDSTGLDLHFKKNLKSDAV